MTVRKIKAGRIPTIETSEYVGEIGTIFYNEDTGVLRLSDGKTIGGLSIAGAAEGISQNFDFGVIAPANITNILDLIFFSTSIDLGTILNPAPIVYDAGTLV